MCHVTLIMHRHGTYLTISQLTSAKTTYVIRCHADRLIAHTFLHAYGCSATFVIVKYVNQYGLAVEVT